MTDAVDPPPTDRDPWDRRARRALLGSLERHVTLSVADLADELAVRGTDDPLTERSAEAVCEIYMALSCTHLPRLARAGAVAYDPDRDLVSLPGHGHDAVADIRLVGDREPTSSDEPR